jgi:hypothetical protein
MDELSTVKRIEDHVTFGVGYAYFAALLVGVFFAFVFGLIRFQNVLAPYGSLSPFLYGGFTLVGLAVSYRLLRRIGTWTFAPTLHSRQSAAVAVGIYFVITIIAVFIGYLIINPEVGAIDRLGFPDALVGVTVASIYTAILSSTLLLQDPAELLGRPKERKRCIEAWLQAYNDAVDADGFGHAHTQAYKEFIDESATLLSELEDAKTSEGEQIRSEFESWFSDFRECDSMVRQQAILTGDTDNDTLSDKHQTLKWVRQQIEYIGGDEVGTN